MLKSLLATCLLTFSCSNGKLKVEHPKNAQLGTALQLKGNYSFKDQFNFDYISNLYNENKELHLEFLTGTCQAFRKRPTSTTYDMYNITNIDIWYNNTYDYVDLTFEYDDDYSFTFEITDNIYINELQNNIEGTTYPSNVQDVIENFTINFTTEYYINGNEQELFNLWFSKNGNRYTSYYNGYYHYNNGNWLNSNYHFKYNGGLWLTNTDIYSSYAHLYDDNDVYYTATYTFDTYTNYYVYENNTYKPNTNFNINSLLPKVVKDSMESEGVFMYVNDTQPTTWYEMILSTMDAPIYYLQQLLGFELFGMNLFIAFSSLLTLVIIIAVIKKVI